MKKTLACFLLFLGAFCMPACKKNKTPNVSENAYNLSVNLHHNFEQDNVKVWIDNRLIFDKQVTTNHSLGLADYMLQTKKKGSHTIKITVNSSISKSKQFSLNDDLYIGVAYDRQLQQISFTHSGTPFLYD